MHSLVTFIAKDLIIISFAALLVPLFKLRGQQRLRYILFVAIGGVVTLALAKLGSALHSDPRPFVRDGVTPYFSSSHDNGFPSDHTLAATFAAAIIFTYRKWAGVALFVLAILIGAARVIGGVHHGQDIIGAMVFSILGVTASYYITKAVAPKVFKTN